MIMIISLEYLLIFFGLSIIMEELITQEDYFAYEQKANYRGQLGQSWQNINKRMISKLFNQDYQEVTQYQYEIEISKSKENKKVRRRKIDKLSPEFQAKCQNILKTNKELLRTAYNLCQQDSFQCYKPQVDPLQEIKKEKQISISKPAKSVKAVSYLTQIKQSICEKQELQYESIKQEKEQIIDKQEILERKFNKQIDNYQSLANQFEQRQRIVRSKSTLFMNQYRNNNFRQSNSPKEKKEEHFLPSTKLKSKSLNLFLKKQVKPYYVKKSSNKHLPVIFCISKQAQCTKSPIHSQFQKRKISLLRHSLSKSKERMIGRSPKQTLKQYVEKEKLILNGKYRLFLHQRPAKLKISSLIPARDPRNQARFQ